MPFILLVLMTSLAFGATPQEINEAKKSIKALIKPLMQGPSHTRPSGTEKFDVSACEKHKINWSKVLLMQEEVTLTYKFKEGCDIQGSIQPKVLQSFPAKLALKNLESYHEVESQNKVTASFEAKPIMNLEMRSGVITGKKGTVKFEADYQVQLNPLSKEKPVEKNLGGVIRITEIYGKKENIKEKILVE